LSVQVGQVYYESWGYDQTNIDYVQIVSVSPSGKTVMCRMMGSERVDEWHVKPTQAFGESFRLYVRRSASGNGETRLVGQYPFCLRPDETLESAKQHGAMRMGYFFPYEKPMYETPFGMGH